MSQYGACYIRVSTEEQTEYSPDAQLKAILKYAKANDIIITKQHIYIDEGISGRKAEKRPEFMKMIATAKVTPKPFDVILVHKFDRFARSREDSVVYKSLLKKEAGIKVVSITESIEDDKFSIILEAMLEAMAEYYSLNLSEEVRKGMTEKAERGGIQSSPAYGYMISNNQFYIVPEEAQYVKFIFEKFSSREMSKRKIAVYLNDHGVRTKRGNKFEIRTIDYIMRNPVYIGKIYWTPEKLTTYALRDYSKAIVRDGTHEPIISLELWDKTQAVLKENDEIYRKRENTCNTKRSWLSGLIHCATCDKILARSNGYFLCNGYAKGQCKDSNSIKIDEAEATILEELKKTYTGEIEINVVPKKSDVSKSTDYELLNSQLSKLSDKEVRIKEAYQDGIDTLDEYKENKRSIEADRKKLIAELKGLKQELLSSKDDTQPLTTTIKSVYDLLSDEKVDMDVKYKSAHLLINRITYSKAQKVMRLEYK